VMAAALMLTRTRGAWLGFAAGFAWYAFKTRRRLLLYGIIAALLGIALSPSPVKERVRSFWDSRLSYSNMERIHMWRTGWRISRDHPVLGIGQGNMEAVYPQYRVPEAKEPVVGHMHNNFMQVLVQNGWVGLLAYLAWIIAYFRDASRFKPRHPGERSLNEGFIAVFIATLVWGLTEYTFSHQYMMVQVFLLGLQWGLMRGFHNPRTNNTPTN
jgi:O-antigen ligase